MREEISFRGADIRKLISATDTTVRRGPLPRNARKPRNARNARNETDTTEKQEKRSVIGASRSPISELPVT